jgi:hypothetical protein
MKLNTRCIRCGTTNNLNTTMVVTIDDKKYDIILCDAHEDTTPKQAKELVKGKIDAFNIMMEQMKEFGITVTDTASGIAVAQKPQPIDIPEDLETQQESEELVEADQKPKARIIKKTSIKIKGITGVAKDSSGGVNVEGHSSIDVDNAAQALLHDAKRRGVISEDTMLPVREDIEFTDAVGKEGVPMRVPKKIKYSDGETKIAIINTGGDQTIQHRLKTLSKQQNSYSYGKDGYDVKPCNACDGTGFSKVKDDACQKCGGVGFLNKGW